MSLPAPILLEAAAGSGAVYEHGAHLTAWTPARHEPVLWLSDLARFEPGVAIRGGVPIVFPWFGAGRSGDLTPAHGFARLNAWRLDDHGLDGDVAFASFSLDGSGAGVTGFPYAFATRYDVRLGRDLDLSLTVENRDDRPFSFEEALHVYFRVGDVRQATVEGLDGCTYLDQADPEGLRVDTQVGDVRFTGETDRIYDSGGRVRVVDPVMGRALVVDRQHSASAVVWNPWAGKAHRMGDFGDDEWPTMLCVEGGNLRDAAVSLEPGQAHEMRYTVTVEQLS